MKILKALEEVVFGVLWYSIVLFIILISPALLFIGWFIKMLEDKYGDKNELIARAISNLDNIDPKPFNQVILLGVALLGMFGLVILGTWACP